MRRRIFLLHSLLLLCFTVTVVPSYGYNEYFIVVVITFSYNGWGRCTATGVIDSTDVVRIPDTVVDDGQTLKVVELSFYGRLPLRHGEVYCPKWLEQISGGCFNYTDIVAIHFQENDYDCRRCNYACLQSRFDHSIVTSKYKSGGYSK